MATIGKAPPGEIMTVEAVESDAKRLHEKIEAEMGKGSKAMEGVVKLLCDRLLKLERAVVIVSIAMTHTVPCPMYAIDTLGTSS